MRYSYQGFFDLPTLTRAYRYANEKRISELVLDKDNVSAMVDGSRNYGVSMQFEDGKLIRATCNCPLENGKCKHAAAILIYLDEQEIKKMEDFQKNSK